MSTPLPAPRPLLFGKLHFKAAFTENSWISGVLTESQFVYRIFNPKNSITGLGSIQKSSIPASVALLVSNGLEAQRIHQQSALQVHKSNFQFWIHLYFFIIQSGPLVREKKDIYYYQMFLSYLILYQNFQNFLS